MYACMCRYMITYELFMGFRKVYPQVFNTLNMGAYNTVFGPYCLDEIFLEGIWHRYSPHSSIFGSNE